MSNKININGKEFTIEELNTLIETAKKPSQIFYENGACVRPLKDGQTYWYINGANDVYECQWNNFNADLNRLANQNLFLSKEYALKALDVMFTHNRILAKIKEIDAENNWKADWSDFNQKKYYVFWDFEHKAKLSDYSRLYNRANIYMSEQSSDWLMSDEVSDSDFRKFLKIYD